jgi:hypothetical protein
VIKRVLLAVVALSAMAASAAVVVAAAAFALYALLRMSLGAAGAAAAVALAFALLIAIFGLVIGLQAKGRRPPPEPSLGERLGQMARERPILAAGGALAAGLIALKNPQVVATIISTILATRAADKTGRNRR